MNVTELPSPGNVSGSHALRKEVARVITQAQISARSSPGSNSQVAKDLVVFFKAALIACNKLNKTKPAQELP